MKIILPSSEIRGVFHYVKGRQLIMRSSILVVDDQSINREILHELFKEQYDIIEARDGQEAIDEI